MRWPRSSWKQASIALGAAIAIAFSVCSYIADSFFETFYFPKTAHAFWHAGLNRESTLWDFIAVGGKVLVATFILFFAIQRVVTERSKSN